MMLFVKDRSANQKQPSRRSAASGRSVDPRGSSCVVRVPGNVRRKIHLDLY
jgi:hypothetical protein